MSELSEPSGGQSTVALHEGDAPSSLSLLDSRPGASIGRYLLIERLGAGGMGVVWRAYDPKLQRELALKMVRTDRLSADAQARIVREARAMAQISHPNVVAVYDVEEEGETVTLAMELVSGGDLKGWLETPRTWSEIVEVFIGAGRGLAEAHAAGILHRDFKPANVLVGTEGRARVTDFGIARAPSSMRSSEDVERSMERSNTRGGSLDSLDSLDSDLTADGTVVGTPGYMAPEQHFAESLDARADQYAFCVSLRAALTGAMPFEGSMVEIAKAKVAGPPAWPRSVDVPRAIVAALDRGMSSQPDDRWSTMGALLESLHHDPGRRRRTMLWGAGVGLGAPALALAVWSGSSAVQPCSGAAEQLSGVWDEARHREVEDAFEGTKAVFAASVWAKTGPALDRYAEEWIAMHTDACEATNVRRDQSAEVMDLRMSCLRRARVQLEATADVLLDADARVVTRAHQLVGGLPSLSRCAEVDALRADVAPPEDPEVAQSVEGAREQIARARALDQAGKPRVAQEHLEQSVAGIEAIDYPPLHTELRVERSKLLQAVGKYAEAETMLRETLEQALSHGQWWLAWDVAVTASYSVGQAQGRHAEALGYLAVAVGLSQRPGFSGRDQASSRVAMATTLRLLGRLEESETQLREALVLQRESIGESAPVIALTHNNLANTLYFQGRYSDSLAEHVIAQQMYRETLGEGHPEIAMSLSNQAGVLLALDRTEEAIAGLREAVEIKERSLGPEHPETSASLNNLAVALTRTGNDDEAATVFRKTVEIGLAAYGPDHPRVGGARANLASVLIRQGELAEAETQLRAAVKSIENSSGPDDVSIASPWGSLSELLLQQERLDEAEAAARTTLQVRLTAQGAEHPEVATAHQHLGRVLRAKGELAPARESLEEALHVVEAGEVRLQIDVAVSVDLADVLWEIGQERGRARQIVETTKSRIPKGDEHMALHESVDDWLAEHVV